MTQQENQFDQKKLCCSICLDLLNDPGTIPCGHSYCMNCINIHWDEEDRKQTYSCPQCRQTFPLRPVLVKNTMLADLAEEVKKTGPQTAPADHCYAGPEDVACDFCTGRKLKALKSCLQCLVSYCEQHLQPHYESPAFEKHKLVQPSKKLQENFCPRHGKIMRIFCRTDQKCICYLCYLDEHKDHDTVSAATERTEKQRELGACRQKIRQRIQIIEKDVMVLQQHVETINHSAGKTVRDSEKLFTELGNFMKNRSSDVKQQITSHQKAEVSRAIECQEKMQQELAHLKKKYTELEELTHTEDHTLFLHNYSLLSQFSDYMEAPVINICPLKHFQEVNSAVSELRDQSEHILLDLWSNITVTGGDVSLPQAEPVTRGEFLQYSCQITLDSNTANTQMLLSKENRRATVMKQKQSHSGHQERFTDMYQVLSRESLSGRCYWEVERGMYEVSVAVAYRDISRSGYQSGFGNDEKSWALECFSNSYEFRHNSVKTFISGPQCTKVGVYLDHSAGILSFYSTETMTLLHRAQTTFTRPLHHGLAVFGSSGDGSAAELCELG